MSRHLILFLFFLCASAPLRDTSAADEPHIVYVGATWCGPCRGAKQFTIPELTKAGVKVIELDYDKDKLPADVTDVPTYFVMLGEAVKETIVGHVHQDVIMRRMAALGRHSATQPPSAQSQSGKSAQPPNATPPPDLVAQLRRFLGTKKTKSHSSIAWSFEEPLDIILDAKTKITRPKHVAAEVDFDGDVLTLTFAEPLPQAHVLKAGATISVDIPRITIRKNVVTATADVAFGLQKDFEFVLTQSPFDD